MYTQMMQQSLDCMLCGTQKRVKHLSIKFLDDFLKSSVASVEINEE